MPVDCSVTNWFYNLIKAKGAREGVVINKAFFSTSDAVLNLHSRFL